MRTNPGDRVSWEAKGDRTAGTGEVIGRGNANDLVRSDEIVAVHKRLSPEFGEWVEHRILLITPGDLTVTNK